MIAANVPWAAAAGGVMLDVRLTPRSHADAIDGVERRADGRAVLKARVRAAPVEGEANDALRKLLAKSLGIAPGRIDVASGASARIKRLRIAGEAPALIAALERAVAKA